MEEVSTCISCGGQVWTIFENRIECAKCKKTYKFENDIKAVDLIIITNDWTQREKAMEEK
jgi:hypothetical protein